MAVLLVHVEHKKIMLTVPPTPCESPLHRGLTMGFCSTSKLASSDLSNGATAELPLFTWRHFLANIRFGFNAFAEFEAQKSKNPLEQLLYQCGDVEHTNPRDIPGPPGYSSSLGTFNLSSQVLRVVDPCCLRDDSGAVLIPSVAGNWLVHIDVEDMRHGYSVARLVAVHETSGISAEDSVAAFQDTPIGHLSVDSGQCAFFDDAHYPLDPHAEEGRLYTLYCSATECSSDMPGCTDYLRTEPASVLPDGTAAITKTFDGDGYFPVRILKNEAGLAIAVEVKFKPDCNDDIEDD